MLFCQLGCSHSLPGIEDGLKSCEGKLVYLGIDPPARSSFSYANARRPGEMFEQVFYVLSETEDHYPQKSTQPKLEQVIKFPGGNGLECQNYGCSFCLFHLLAIQG